MVYSPDIAGVECRPMDDFGLSWLLVTVVPLFILLGLTVNYRRAREWQEKARTHGHVYCRDCGHVGDLQVRAISGGNSSSNLRLVCGKCNSTHWTVPEEDRLP